MKQLLSFLLFILAFSLHAQINTDRVLTIGKNALYFEDYVLSIQYFNQAIVAKPHLAEPYFYRAIAKLNLEDYKGAKEDCSQAIKRNKFLVKAYIVRSYAEINLSQFEESIEDCLYGISLDQTNEVLKKNIIISYTESKQFSHARTELDKYIKENPYKSFGYISRGHLEILTGDTLGAIDDYSRAISVDKYYAPAYAGRAYVYLVRKEYKNAIPDLNEAIRINPDYAGYYINRGIARYNINQLQGTLDDFDRVIRLEPNNKVAYLNRGLIRGEVGDYNRAIEDFDKVIFLDSNDDAAIYNRAMLHEKVGEYEKAIADLSTIIKRHPYFVPAIFERSKNYKILGLTTKSEKDYFAALKIQDEKPSEKKKSNSSDSTLVNYNKKIIVKTTENEKTKYDNPMRGKVQNFNAEIEPQDIFSVSLFSVLKPGPQRVIYDISKQTNDKIYIINDKIQLTKTQVSDLFDTINNLSGQLSQNKNSELYFKRALNYAQLKDIENSIIDLDSVIELDPQNLLAYFQRANLRVEKLAVTNDNPKMSKDFTYNLIYKDYQKVIELDPNFIYVYYNLGNIRFSQRDYRNAIDDYSNAIKLNKSFAHAWFNRGISKLALGDRENGLSDLRMAGQLGIYKAYNIIKRYDK